MMWFLLYLPQVCTFFLSADVLTNILVINRLLSNYSQKQRFFLLLRECLFSLIAMILLFWATLGATHVLHTPSCAIRTVGGIIITLIGIRATLRLNKEEAWSSYSSNSSSLPFVTPIAMPLIIGPSWLGACCAFISKSSLNATSTYIVILSWALITCATFILHFLINPGKIKLLVTIQTILGLFVTIVGAQILISGLQSTFL